MNLAIIANPDKYAVKKPFKEILKWADENDVTIFFNHSLKFLINNGVNRNYSICDSEQEAIDKSDIVISLGGDGTMLWTARLVKKSGKPILGVNSGRLGFMANTQLKDLIPSLNHLKNGNYKEDRRFLLHAKDNAGNVYHALNEFLFTKKGSASMITVDVLYDDMFINKYWADGLIVATPTGSTAYNLSSGGPIVMPQTSVMVVTPINPHTLTTRPLVLPVDKVLKIRVQQQEHEVLFSYDGEICEITQYPFEIEIKRSDFTIDILELPGQSYFETLRTKLMWGLDFREQV
ncbi:MAG TPA: NAD(+)/NADH kinase [Balneolales bacterium]|nr:NAD(+)/NADH kinase [Balneolales bacterium]